jgi:CheY-like chemotaxis protein
MHLPHVSGLEILTYIRQDPRFKHTKVVVITANAHLVADLESQADLTLLKPVSVSQISSLSTRLLDSIH